MMTESLGNLARGAGARRRRIRVVFSVLLASLLAACGTGSAAGESQAARSLILYTCLSDESIQPVIKAFEARDDGGQVKLFRAPTGELNARVAADVRSGGPGADVFWGCDPLTVQALADQGLVGGGTPADAKRIPAQLRTEDYVRAHVLYMVAVHRTNVPAPEQWADLA